MNIRTTERGKKYELDVVGYPLLDNFSNLIGGYSFYYEEPKPFALPIDSRFFYRGGRSTPIL